MNGNKATSYGLIAAAEKAGLQLFLGSYPITPATDILHELSKRKDLGVITVRPRMRSPVSVLLSELVSPVAWRLHLLPDRVLP